MVEQVGSERVPQRVRGKLAGNACLAGIALDDVPEGLAGHAVAAPGRKQIVGLTLEQDLAARTARELLEPAHRLLTQWDEALAVALTHDADDTLIEIDLRMAQVNELGDAQPSGVEHLEHRAIAVAEGVADGRSVQQRLDFFLAERLRQRAPDLGHRDLRRGIFANGALAHQVAEEAAETRELARR